MNLAGKVALVTGAGQGIGKAIVRLLIESGANVAVNDIQEGSAATACRELDPSGQRAVPAPADVADQTAVDLMVGRAVDRLGPIDILVNNAAAAAQIIPFQVTTPAVQQQELVTLLGAFHCTRRVLPDMIQRRQGRIINISSIAAHHGTPGRAVYSAAKAGVEAFSKALAAEVGQYGITVNCVSPGATESPRFQARSEDVRRAHRQMISLDRFAQPQEIAQAVLFLASDFAGYITGAAVVIDGGFRGYPPLKDKAE